MIDSSTDPNIDSDLSCDSESTTSSLSQTSSSLASPVPSDITFSESSVDCDLATGHESCTVPSKLPTYKLVGDNIDKTVHPREMRSDHQTRSLHYFHAYAVRDRVDVSRFSSDHKVPDLTSIKPDLLLPTSCDEAKLRENFAILVARTLMKYMPFFAKFGRGLEKHIVHEFSTEMAQKSEVVSGFAHVRLK